MTRAEVEAMSIIELKSAILAAMDKIDDMTDTLKAIKSNALDIYNDASNELKPQGEVTRTGEGGR